MSAPVEGVLRGDFAATRKIDFDDFFLVADSFVTDDRHLNLDRNGVADLDDFFISADNFGLVAAAD